MGYGVSEGSRSREKQETFRAVSGDVLQRTGDAAALFPVFLPPTDGIRKRTLR
jgi:hypothetical protein